MLCVGCKFYEGDRTKKEDGKCNFGWPIDEFTYSEAGQIIGCNKGRTYDR